MTTGNLTPAIRELLAIFVLLEKYLPSHTRIDILALGRVLRRLRGATGLAAAYTMRSAERRADLAVKMSDPLLFARQDAKPAGGGNTWYYTLTNAGREIGESLTHRIPDRTRIELVRGYQQECHNS